MTNIQYKLLKVVSGMQVRSMLTWKDAEEARLRSLEYINAKTARRHYERLSKKLARKSNRLDKLSGVLLRIIT